jgi:carbon storage regulator
MNKGLATVPANWPARVCAELGNLAAAQNIQGRKWNMLVLSRKKNERIMIGDNIAVTIVEIHPDRVKLGFVGPHDVPIHREEVYRRIDTWHPASTMPASR